MDTLATISRTAHVSDIDIAFTSTGTGAPLVVVHGAIGLGSTYMRPLDAWASDGRRVIQYDQRGSGQTPLGDVAKASFGGGLEDLDALRSTLGLEQVSLVGHSAGAHLAALYAGRYAERVTSLVLLNTAPPLRPDLAQEFGAAMQSGRTPADNAARRALEASPAFARGEPSALEQHQLNTFLPFFRDRATVETASLGFTEITAANIQAAPDRMIGSLGALDPMATYAGIASRTLVVHGELDPVPEAWSRLLAETIPGADYVVLPGASHFAHLEDFEELSDAVLPWLG